MRSISKKGTPTRIITCGSGHSDRQTPAYLSLSKPRGNTSSMPEVGGPDILAADPCRPEEIAGAVLRLENEDALYRQQREYGLLRARQFSWKKTADELIQVYQSLDI